MKPTEQLLGDGVTFLALSDERFTTARLTVNFYVPLAEETAGRYALLPFLLRRGCRAYPDMMALHRRLDRLYGAYVTADVSRTGETQMLTLGMTCLNDPLAPNGEPIAASCAELLLQMLFEPPLVGNAFRIDDVEQERRCTLEMIASEINDKHVYARAQCERLLCKGEPYAVSRYGTKEQVEALTAAELTAAWRGLLQCAPVKIIYQGSGDAQAVAAAFARRFKSRQVHTLPPVTHLPAKTALAIEQEEMEVNQCQLVLGYRTVIDGAHPLADAMRLANAVLGGTAHSLLFKHVREEQSLCYHCRSVYDRRKGVLLIDSGVERDDLEKAKTAITCQLAALQNGDFSDEELDNAKLSVCDALLSAEDSASTTAYWYAAQAEEPLRTPAQVAEAVRGVTRAQVLAAAATIIPDCVYTLMPRAKEETV